MEAPPAAASLQFGLLIPEIGRDDGSAVFAVYFVYPETKGYSLEGMHRHMGAH